MANRINYKHGDIVGNCTFLEDAENISYNLNNGKNITFRRGKFKCFCGKEFISMITFVKNKKTKSCGCIKLKWAIGRKQHVKHGHSFTNKKSQEYRIWTGMKNRCKQNNIDRHLYFDKGIIVCERWNNKIDGFQNFLKDMGNRPSDKHSMDRIDGNLGYYPENCRWATIKEQNGNKSSNVMISYKGQIKCLEYWAKDHNLNRSTLEYRLWRGWDIEKALETPTYRENS